MPLSSKPASADARIPTLADFRKLYLYTPSDITPWGRPLSARQAQYLSALFSSPAAVQQLTVTLRPDVDPEITFEYQAFDIYCAHNITPPDSDLATLHEHPLIEYDPAPKNLATRLALLIQVARSS